MAYERRMFKGAAAKRTLASGINSAVEAFTLDTDPGATWPDGSTGNFFAVIDRGLAGEEKLRCSARTGASVTVLSGGRGADDTAASAHSSGAFVEHVFTALDANEANYWVSELSGSVSAGAGRLAVSDAANSLTGLANGTTGHPLVAGASTPAYGQLGTTGIADDAVTNDKINNMTRGTVKVGGAANAPTDLNAKTSGQILVGDGTDILSVAVSGDATLAANGALTLSADSVGVAEIAADSVGLSEATDAILKQTTTFSQAGTLATGTGSLAWRAPFAVTMQHVRLRVGTAPTGASILVDLNKNGTTMFTTQGNRPTIVASATTESATTAPDVTAVAAGDNLTVDIDQVGSTIPGSNLTVTVYYVLA